MNIILAQLRKDIQCQRGLLIVWAICAGLSVVPFAASYLIPHFHPASDANMGTIMVYALGIGGMVMACALIVALGMFVLVPLLVVRIVHEDVLLGTTTFWRTRPIPREKLLGAKALLTAGLLIPPIILAEITNFSFGSGQFWAANLAWIAAFAAVASITSGAKDFMIYAVALLFGKGIFASLLQGLWTHFHGERSAPAHAGHELFYTFTQSLHLSPSDFFHLCYFTGFAAVFIHQYLTLQTKRSLAIMIGVLVTISVLQVLIETHAIAPVYP
jgi:hypothetical protein